MTLAPVERVALEAHQARRDEAGGELADLVCVVRRSGDVEDRTGMRLRRARERDGRGEPYPVAHAASAMPGRPSDRRHAGPALATRISAGPRDVIVLSRDPGAQPTGGGDAPADRGRASPAQRTA
jgi:hypothetical protein